MLYGVDSADRMSFYVGLYQDEQKRISGSIQLSNFEKKQH
jgi:hypothetical protein